MSAVELAKAAFREIGRCDPKIGAFVELDERRALRAASAADVRLKTGGALPAFLGVPTAIKDHEHMRWMHTRVGSRALAWVISPMDSKIAKRCRDGGFVLVGKTSCSELTILPYVHTDLGPPTRNPRSLEHYSGGSSGGAAAAVAGGMLPIAPGSDGAGSIRVPASFSGLVGIKPGRFTLFHDHSDIDTIDISAIGPLARTMKDAAALMDVLNGQPDVAPKPGSFLAATEWRPRGLKIRVGLASPIATVDPEIEAATRRVAKILEAQGHHVDEGGPLDVTVDEFLPLMARMTAKVPMLPLSEHLLQPTTRWLRAMGKRESDAEVKKKHAVLQQRVDAWFGADVDVWVLPTSAVLPPKVGSLQHLDGPATFHAIVPIGAFTAAFNVSGQPAVSLPVATSKSGLPIGVQLVVKRGDDRRLLGLATAVEEALR